MPYHSAIVGSVNRQHYLKVAGRIFCLLVCVALATTGCTDSAASGSSGRAARTNTSTAPRLGSDPVTTPSSDASSDPIVGSDSAVSSPAIEPAPQSPSTSRVDEVLGALTLQQKVGQLLVPVVFGTDAHDVSAAAKQANMRAFGVATPSEVVTKFGLGGVIYLEHNIEAAPQVEKLSAGLQTSSNAANGVGLLIAVDQEGGRVNRLTDGVTVFPPASILSGNSAAVHEAGYLTGRQVKLQGVNVVLAPVADLNEPGSEGAIGNRSYGNDPTVVSEMVVAAVDGLQEAGVAAAVKHWPGHGPTGVDSHDSLPSLTITQAEWESRDMLPFVAAIDRDVSIVLVGHLSMPSIDPSGAPATSSPVLIQQLLREGLGFDGVVITDALNMGAVGDSDPRTVAVAAVSSGADIVLMPPDLPLAHEALLSAVETGELPIDRLDDAVRRVLQLKADLGLLPPL